MNWTLMPRYLQLQVFQNQMSTRRNPQHHLYMKNLQVAPHIQAKEQ
jgi:hypothetical protein